MRSSFGSILQFSTVGMEHAGLQVEYRQICTYSCKHTVSTTYTALGRERMCKEEGGHLEEKEEEVNAQTLADTVPATLSSSDGGVGRCCWALA